MKGSTALRVKELLREKGWTTKVLAEKTGMSESYLTHIKNGTRRWNEDSLRKLAGAFEVNPIDLFSTQRNRTDDVEDQVDVKLPEKCSIPLTVSAVPVVGDIPAKPSAYNNQLMQTATGFADTFVPVFNNNDSSMFAYAVENNLMAPFFVKGDKLIVSPESWARSGDIAAVEYGNETIVRTICRITFSEEFVVLESVNQKTSAIALVQGKDHFRIIGRVLSRMQTL